MLTDSALALPGPAHGTGVTRETCPSFANSPRARLIGARRAARSVPHFGTAAVRRVVFPLTFVHVHPERPQADKSDAANSDSAETSAICPAGDAGDWQDDLNQRVGGATGVHHAGTGRS